MIMVSIYMIPVGSVAGNRVVVRFRKQIDAVHAIVIGHVVVDGIPA